MDPITKNECYNGEWLPYWQPNNSATKCSTPTCETTFNLVNRRHHCRNCGKIFCSLCWGKESFVEVYNRKVQVCNSCYIHSDD